MSDAPKRTEVDFSHVRRRTFAEVNYWLDQALLRIAELEQEVARLRDIISPGDAAAYEEGMAALEQENAKLRECLTDFYRNENEAYRAERGKP